MLVQKNAANLKLQFLSYTLHYNYLNTHYESNINHISNLLIIKLVNNEYYNLSQNLDSLLLTKMFHLSKQLVLLYITDSKLFQDF